MLNNIFFKHITFSTLYHLITLQTKTKKSTSSTSLSEKMTKTDMTPTQALARLSELTASLSPEDLEELQSNISVSLYKKNETIYEEGDTPTHLMCPLTGKVKIYKGGVAGRNQIIRVIKPLEYFGYRAWFAHESYVTTSAAFEQSLIAKIPLTTLDSLLSKNTRLALFFIHRLSIDLGVSDRRTVNLTQKHIRGRLAESILFLRDSYGLEEDGCTLSIYLSREDLAGLSNMTTSNAIRTLAGFVDDRIIAVDGRKIKIISLEKLQKISKLG